MAAFRPEPLCHSGRSVRPGRAPPANHRMTTPTTPDLEALAAEPPKARRPATAPANLGWTLAWAVVFCDIGTSVYYVPGILYGQVGDLSTLFVLGVSLGFILLAIKYAEVTITHPEGGGVVSVATQAFGPTAGALGGMLITTDYFLTSAISTVSGFHYLSSIFPGFGPHVVLLTVVALILMGAINIIGLRESATLALGFAGAALLVDLGVIGLAAFQLRRADLQLLFEQAAAVQDLSPYRMLVGFSGAWLAFSGLESVSQLSPTLRRPIATTAHRTTIAVIVTVLLTSPLLTALSMATLVPVSKAAGSEHLISELAGAHGGLLARAAVVVTAGALLLLAANTAIIGSYHVFLALSRGRYLPRQLAARNTRYGTPHRAILLATVVPVFVVLFTSGHLELLGDMYSFGLLGAFTFTAVGLDVARWRDKRRGLMFVVGLLTSVMVATAWGVNIVAKPHATLFGGAVTALGLLAGISIRRQLPIKALNRLPQIARRAAALRARVVEEVLEHEPILDLEDARAVRTLLPSTTLAAVRGQNPRLIAEAIRRVKGVGGVALYVISITEWPGLFSGEQMRPDPEVITAFNEASALAAREGITVVPIWAISGNAAATLAEAAIALSVDAVMMGVSQRGAIYHMLRGNVLQHLARLLPDHIRIVTVG